ncbi:hypothetical protein, partial [Nocardia sp. NPDC051981]|uniref:hypothetical protein n=1 Tax=Nocardia sp. NPDC051981 TaxID=3155417 RepID=UPI0034332628
MATCLVTARTEHAERTHMPHTALTEPASAEHRKINGQSAVRPPAVHAHAEFEGIGRIIWTHRTTASDLRRAGPHERTVA